MSAKPSRHGIGARSVTWTTWYPGSATTPDENGAMPGRKR